MVLSSSFLSLNILMTLATSVLPVVAFSVSGYYLIFFDFLSFAVTHSIHNFTVHFFNDACDTVKPCISKVVVTMHNHVSVDLDSNKLMLQAQIQ